MNLNSAFSFKNPLPRLAELTEKASDWLSGKSTHNANFMKWRNALDSAPKDDARASPPSMDNAARAFSAAFAVYDRPHRPDEMKQLSRNDLHNAMELSKAWESTMEVAGQQGLISRNVLMTHEASMSFVKNVSTAVAKNTACDCVEYLDARSVGTALRAADFLLKACEAHEKAQPYLPSKLEGERFETFRQAQNILQAEVSLGTYGGTPVLEQKLKEALLESGRVLESIDPGKSMALTQENKIPSGPAM